MPAQQPTPSSYSSTIDRLALVFALVALSVGCYVIYTKISPDRLTSTLERLADESFVRPVHLHARDIDFDTEYFGHRYRGNTRNLIDSHVLCYGAWEKWMLYFLRDSVAAVGDDEAVFVDVGANSGLHTLFMSSHAGTVHAVEPYPPAVARIEEGVSRNSLTNVVVHPVGFGAADAVLPFFEPPDSNVGTGSFLEKMNDSNDAKGLELHIVRADEYFESQGVDKVDFMKIDIEGYERPALEGMRKLLEKNRPVVVLEVSVDPAQDALFSSMEQFRAAFPANYDFFAFANQSLAHGSYELAPMKVDFQSKDQHDVIAAPAEKSERLPKEADYSDELRKLSEAGVH